MAQKKITDLPALTSADSTDVLEVVDVSANANKKVTVDGLIATGSISTAKLADDAVTPAKWVNPYVFSAYCSSGKAISGTTLIVDLQTELFDPNGNFSSSRYTVPVSGYYQINARAWLGSAGAGTSEFGSIQIRKNGSNAGMPHSDQMNGSGDGNRLIRPSINSLIQLTAGDYIELWAAFTGTRDIVAGQSYTYMNGFLVSQS